MFRCVLVLLLLSFGVSHAGNPNFSSDSGTIIGSGWHGPHLFGGKDGVIYIVTGDQRLHWYQATGTGDFGTDGDAHEAWAGGSGSVVGTGWDFVYVLGGYDGVVYAVTHENNGNLLWYKRESDGPDEAWHAQSATVVGRGGWRMSKVFGGGGGLIFAVENGELIYYRHLGDPSQGTDGWRERSGEVIASGWDRFDLLTSDSDGVILAREASTGDLYYYRWDEDAWSWAVNGVRIGAVWGEMSNLIMGPNGYVYAQRDDGAMVYYEIAQVTGLALTQLECIRRTYPPDGCSFPESMRTQVSDHYNEKFRSACDGHDICYATDGQTKGACDTAFLEDMAGICGTTDAACLTMSGIYSGGVALSTEGQESWDNASNIRRNCAP